MLSILQIIYLQWYRPFSDKRQNRREIFNEVCLALSAYHLIIFSDFVDDVETKYLYGWSVSAVMLLNALKNCFDLV